jgi:hypothetical protein
VALRFVKNQTLEICLEAVKKDSRALIYAKEQNIEICIEAVKRKENISGYFDITRYLDIGLFENDISI